MDTLKRKKEINTEFASKDKSKEELEKYTEHWDEIKCLIKTINGGEAGEYEKECMKIKSNSHDTLFLNKILKFHNLAIVVRSVFQEDNKYYPQAFLDECLF